MTDLWTDLLDCLDLRPDSTNSADSTTSPVLRGPNQQLEYHRLFGGQLLAQFIRAACLSCPDKTVKSLHVLFPKEGAADETVGYETTTHHNGRSFATLSIVARQAGRAIATAAVSMHAAEDGTGHQSVPPPPAVPGAEHRVELGLLPWETRTTTDLDSPAAGAPEAEVWMRLPAVDAALAPALTAYATDLTLIGTALRPLDGIGQGDAGRAFVSAVTSHTLWFHRPFRDVDGWLLMRQHSPIVANGRCYGRGDVLSEDGVLLASYAQEALLRMLS